MMQCPVRAPGIGVELRLGEALHAREVGRLEARQVGVSAGHVGAGEAGAGEDRAGDLGVGHVDALQHRARRGDA